MKAVVVFAGARDGYQLPLALHEAGLLEALVTDMYWPADRRWFAATAGRVLPARWVRARFCPGLDSRRVRIAWRAWAAAAAARLAGGAGSGPRLARLGDRYLGAKARRLALGQGAALLSCSYYAAAAFGGGADRPRYRLLFQLHPHPLVVRALLAEELARVPAARASLRAELELALPEPAFAALAGEPHLANGWLAASSYTAATLAAQGIPAARIHVVPYGVAAARFPRRRRPPAPRTPFTAIFVGRLVQRKGLADLLAAARLLHSRQIRVILCGRGQVDRTLLAEYADVAAEVLIGLSDDQLVSRLHAADVFVLPSLCEGFGHVILEAMATGLPVIATRHTCAPDVLCEGVQGFIVPIRDAGALAARLAWAADHRAELAALGDAAAIQARQFTWERFRAGVRAAYTRLLLPAD